MARFTALLDANVLYSMTMIDITIELARAGVFRALWSEDIHREWMLNLIANRTDLSTGQVERRRKAMDEALPDPLVPIAYRDLIENLALPDPDDRHVLAAAIMGKADVIVTMNYSHFPSEVLGPLGIEAQHPDVFLVHQMMIAEPLLVVDCYRNVLSRLTRNNSPDEYIAALGRAGLPLVAETVAQLKQLL